MNPIVRGWVNYFRVGNSSRAFGKVRDQVERKVRRFAAKKSKRTGYGWKRWSSASSGINVSSGTKIRALFVAPRALVTVSTSSFTGAIAAAQVLMSPGATVACEDGLGSM